MLYITLLVCLVLSFVITPFIIKLAFKIGATDCPDNRKVHTKVMPRMGGLAIYVSFLVGSLLISPADPFHYSILIGSFVIVLVGVLDDIYNLSAKMKLAGQITAALIVIIYGGLQIEFINLPFGGVLEFGLLSIPITLFWIVAITNAINLIDGLDGLAAGVSAIALVTLGAMAVIMGNYYVIIIALVLLASTLGFLYFNFHPAKIFMGDTGALFLGYMIAVLSLLGFKNITLVALIIPVLILGVPIADTIFAIIRRRISKIPFYVPDRSHLHHSLLDYGFSHRQTVLIIYLFSAIFSIAAILFSMATVWGAIVIILIMLIALELLVEVLGLINKNYRPILNFLSLYKSRFIKDNN
ncbi:UDP-GlcNAc:undecaprenyl-phosphate GlcNAc-1-phosphate transferase [Evansella vedderi]|uniref:UDP-GlcNAc:undecaprenyl-phosphate GlcNAc-1-phosphate transferase n=1 Tax=Evansella vedderi TaxID=38282 RepID=A0ABT9ZTE4_9BACI|nr:MraY family glycosyltransferase [Evansella vedderi]MDQ0254505.1 UDP-GlcNAc:undecaprenyl-phosphate GlcNAc-1-phosphate transferase [Evansella vedderi]